MMIPSSPMPPTTALKSSWDRSMVSVSAVGEQEGEADDLAGEAPVAPRILSVDVGTDRAGDTGV